MLLPRMYGNSLWKYTTQVTPAISCAVLVLLLVFSFGVDPLGVDGEAGQYHHVTFWQFLLSIHILVLHVIATSFPLRLLYALKHVVKKVNEAGMVDHVKGPRDYHYPLLFVIIIPAYKEDTQTLRKTLDVLASHPQARFSYHVYLAIEEPEEDATAKATSLVEDFSDCFFGMSFTLHPYGLPNEAPGKSSNESWAAKQVCKDYPYPMRARDIIITTMDADTHLSARYFTQILQSHLAAPSETRMSTIYMPPLVFDRNLHHVPLPVRTVDIIWAGAGISNMYPNSSVCIPTSVYSLPVTLVEQVGGWDADYGAIGEDLHMYLKCFFALSGNLQVQVIYAPASQCNITSGFTGIKGYIGCIWARYQQAVRHMWGALDTGFAIRQAIKMLIRGYVETRERKVKAVAADGQISAAADSKIEIQAARVSTSPTLHIQWTKVVTVFLRLFEAHFVPVQLALALTASGCYTLIYPGFLIPPILKATLDFCSACRMVSFVLMLGVFYRYEQYHRLCIGLRREEMRIAGLLGEMMETDTFSPNVFLAGGILEAALFPLGGFIFGAIPALQAIATHIFTKRLVYKVSLKPQLLHRSQKFDVNADKGTFGLSRAPSLDLESRGSSEFSDAV